MKNKLKILIMGINNYTSLGGAELYNLYLIKLIKEKYGENVEIYYSYFINDSKKIHNDEKDVKIIWPLKDISNKGWFDEFIYLLKFKYFIKKHLQNNKYDLIINSTIIDAQKFNKNLNIISVQHQSMLFFSFQFCFTKPFGKFINFMKKILSLSWNVEEAKQVVCYTKNEGLEMRKYFGKKKIFDIPLSNSSFITKTPSIEKHNNKLIYIGRMENLQKRIKLLIKTAKYLNMEVDLYGDGKEIDFVKNKKHKNINYMGVLKENKNEIMKKYFAALLLSRYEGMCYFLIESLYNGLPIITTNNSYTCKYLIDNDKNGFLMNIKWRKKKLAQFINKKIEDLKANDSRDKMSMNCQNFANKNLTFNKFVNSWKKTLDFLIKE